MRGMIRTFIALAPPSPSCPLIAPPSHLPSHMSATVAFVLLVGISSLRPSFHYPPLSLPSQSLPSSELSPVPYPHTFSFSFPQSHSPRHPLTAPLALSPPSSSPCLTSAELCHLLPTHWLLFPPSPYPHSSLLTLFTLYLLIPPSSRLLPPFVAISPAPVPFPRHACPLHALPAPYLAVAVVTIITLLSSPAPSACVCQVEDFNVNFIMAYESSSFWPLVCPRSVARAPLTSGQPILRGSIATGQPPTVGTNLFFRAHCAL
ncbi:hypothetical protein EDB86DRAFT_2097193 [Lactarius hatsudake]|nr:hypothetical protein EDB86DRAFT_2097193 [Lactarius hatsudake]